MDKNFIIPVLKYIQYKKLLNDNSLGSYSKVHLKHLYENYPQKLQNLIKSNEIIDYLNYIQKHALDMKTNAVNKYKNEGYDYVTCLKIAEEIVIGYLTSIQKI